VEVSPLIDDLIFVAFLTDKAFDSNIIIAELGERGAIIGIFQHLRYSTLLPLDREMYK
jgi:hypothetical protein